MSDQELIALWESQGKPKLPVAPGRDGELITNLRQFLEAGPGPLEQHRRRWQEARDTAERTLRASVAEVGE